MNARCVSKHTQGKTGFPGSFTANTPSAPPVWMSCPHRTVASALSLARCVAGLPVLVSASPYLGPCGSTHRFGTRSQRRKMTRTKTQWTSAWRIAQRSSFPMQIRKCLLKTCCLHLCFMATNYTICRRTCDFWTAACCGL